MPKKKSIKIDKEKESGQNTIDDIVFEDDSIDISGKVKSIQNKLKECEKERQEYLNGWQRARAEAVNKDREMLQEREKAISRAETNIFVELLPILDSFDMAFSNKEAWEKVDENWRKGIEQIYSQATQIFENAGVSTIEADGDFNPHKHEPVKIEEVDTEEEDDSILGVIQKGYSKGDNILRPAKVIIGKFK